MAGRNKRILEQYSQFIPFYGFSNEGQQTYTFLGLLELLRHYQENQIDKTRALRSVWLFEFRIHKDIPVVPIENAKELTTAFLIESRKNTFADEREIFAVETPENIADDAANYELEELRSQLLQINPYRFEHLVKEVIEVSGFKDVSVTSASQDGGIDVNAYVPDSNHFFSRTHVQFQVKRWRHSVGSVEINAFRGALNTTAKGVFVTTSHFTKAAMCEADHSAKPCISLIDGAIFSKIVKDLRVNLSRYK